MTGGRTFVEVLAERVEAEPRALALTLLVEEDGELVTGRELSYHALDLAARRLAARLREHCAAGDRVLVPHASQDLFAIGFLACLYAGVIAVPVARPGGGGHHDQRVAGVVRDAAVRCVLTDAAGAVDVSQLLARTGFSEVTCVLVDAEPVGGAPEPVSGPPAGVSEDDVAYLQYTSGSTREPRGVMVTHRNLLANQAAIQRAFGTDRRSRIGGWLPLHHDMGLVGQLLHPLWLGASTVMFSATSFVRKPVRWLQTVARHRLTLSGAPDFAYELCVRKVNDMQIAALDLSHWRTAVNGGEPVRAETLRAFAERFAAAGFDEAALAPCYGLAEATLLVSGSSAAAPSPRVRGTAEADAGPVPHCGPPTGGEVRVVDPRTGRPLPDGRTGEIWVRGDSVAPGYWRRPLDTARTFDAELPTPTGVVGGHLRTGDLGYLADGLLRVTGRIKDMITVGGRNVYPQDLEGTAQRVSAMFGAATAFSVPGERERVILVQELRTGTRHDLDLSGLAAEVEQRIGEEQEIHVDGLLFVRPGTVRRTTSGKVERRAMRELFLRGELHPLHQRLAPDVQRLVTAGAAA
ncbi:fatty acyl-AMP ligase [Streptomyces durbertensis]|uniref:Fatty acyl-AMP ligase n=1 Tax=Streptomyces durbertensis TaxID=2448886 RepID=A0ABR6EB55_9ACTN|nr:fatty acyl-AMP ligase [Streptomyces durbertensis]MBB1242205.1 fatty acyl-AMP ligase [Streptomyces durbertensis]